MITENRLKHSLGVARKAYNLAKDSGRGEDFARRMFVLGFLHDVGYEFSDVDHGDVSAEMMRAIGVTDADSLLAVGKHGKYPKNQTLEWEILTRADMLTDPCGNEVEAWERLKNIKERYGEHSDEYLTACDVCYRIGLTGINMSQYVDE